MYFLLAEFPRHTVSAMRRAARRPLVSAAVKALAFAFGLRACAGFAEQPPGRTTSRGPRQSLHHELILVALFPLTLLRDIVARQRSRPTWSTVRQVICHPTMLLVIIPAVFHLSVVLLLRAPPATGRHSASRAEHLALHAAAYAALAALALWRGAIPACCHRDVMPHPGATSVDGSARGLRLSPPTFATRQSALMGCTGRRGRSSALTLPSQMGCAMLAVLSVGVLPMTRATCGPSYTNCKMCEDGGDPNAVHQLALSNYTEENCRVACAAKAYELDASSGCCGLNPDSTPWCTFVPGETSFNDGICGSHYATLCHDPAYVESTGEGASKQGKAADVGRIGRALQSGWFSTCFSDATHVAYGGSYIYQVRSLMRPVLRMCEPPRIAPAML